MKETKNGAMERLKKAISILRGVDTSEAPVYEDMNLENRIMNYMLLEKPTYVFCNDTFYRVIEIFEYPESITLNYLDNLFYSYKNINVVFYYSLQEIYDTMKEVKASKYEIRSTRDIKNKTNADTDDLDIKEGDVKSVFRMLLKGKDRVVKVSFYILIKAQSEVELNKNTQEIERLLASMMLNSRRLYFNQLRMFMTCLPFCDNQGFYKQDFTTKTLSRLYPFVGMNLDQSGFFLGFSKHSNTYVYLDLFRNENGNMIISGLSGSGKSMTLKKLIDNSVVTGIGNFVIEFQSNEYKYLDSYGFKRLEINTYSDLRIGIMDLPSVVEERYKNVMLTRKINYLIPFFKRVTCEPGTELNYKVKSILEENLKSFYISRNFSEEYTSILNRAGGIKQMPTLTEFYDYLIDKQLTDIPEMDDFLLKLRRFTNYGNIKIFADRTNYDFQSARNIVFDVSSLEKDYYNVFMYIICGMVMDICKSSNKDQYRILWIDEFWYMLEDEETARFSEEFVRTIRKFGGALCCSTRQLDDFLSSKYGRAIINNSCYRVLMKQENEAVKQAYGLTDEEYEYLTSCEEGECIVISGIGSKCNKFLCKVSISEEEYKRFDTSRKVSFKF